MGFDLMSTRKQRDKHEACQNARTHTEEAQRELGSQRNLKTNQCLRDVRANREKGEKGKNQNKDKRLETKKQ